VFGTRGYRATTFRAIADSAGVDPGLITHYFGSKEALFVAALELPVPPPSELFGKALELPRAQAARLIVRTYLSLLDDPHFRDAILALVRSAVAEEHAAAMLRDFLTDSLIAVVAGAARGPGPELQASLVAAHLIGIAMLRYVLGVDALSRASADELVALVAPAIAGYLK
jgi:AcrR family transcriptional regulator